MSSERFVNPNILNYTSPPAYENISQNYNVQQIGLPPPSYPGVELTNSIICQVCRNVINLDQRENFLVVKCNNCNEATPIKAAPPGKKYVRCTCNGLLVCKSESTQVGCPRPHCRALITLTATTNGVYIPSAVTSQTNLLTEQFRLRCGHCSGLFVITVNTDSTKYFMARCPHCQKKSSVGPYYNQMLCIILTLFGLAVISIGIALMVTTNVWFFGFIIFGFFMLLKGALFCRDKVSIKESMDYLPA